MAASHLRKYIAACEGFGWQGGPTFRTRIVMMANGRERRNAQWAQARHLYQMPFLNISQAKYASIKNMHLVCLAQVRAFLYWDPLGHAASGDVVGIAVPGQQEFQLSVLSENDGVYYQGDVFALYTPAADGAAIQAVPVLYVDGIATTEFSVDYDRGRVVFDVPMAGGEEISWDGQYSRWVRFNHDDLPMSIDNKTSSSYAINGRVELIEDAPPEEDLSGS